MTMSMSCTTCAYLIFSLKLWSGNMYMYYFISKCDALNCGSVHLNYDRAFMFYFEHAASHQGCWQFWTYIKTLFYHSIPYIEFIDMLRKINLYVCSWIFLLSKLVIFCSSIPPPPPNLSKAHPPSMNNIFMPKMHSVYSQWVWLSISIIRMPVIRDFWDWVICIVNQKRSLNVISNNSIRCRHLRTQG